MLEEEDVEVKGEGGIDEHEGDVLVALHLQDGVGEEADPEF